MSARADFPFRADACDEIDRLRAELAVERAARKRLAVVLISSPTSQGHGRMRERQAALAVSAALDEAQRP